MPASTKFLSLDRKSFLLGFGGGFLSLLLLFIIFLIYLWPQGVTVPLDSEMMAYLLQEQFVALAKEQLPTVVEKAKAEVPQVVQKRMQNQLPARMEIAGFVFRMPDELLQQLESNLQNNVQKTTEMILDGIDTSQLAVEFGDSVYEMVKETMKKELDGQDFQILLFNRLPLKIWLKVH
ncbi:MAG: hypothetical protein GX357_09725 [Firmicutes bacterium]|nr:hypothetical protein [Bacillota bacterium]